MGAITKISNNAIKFHARFSRITYRIFISGIETQTVYVFETSCEMP